MFAHVQACIGVFRKRGCYLGFHLQPSPISASTWDEVRYLFCYLNCYLPSQYSTAVVIVAVSGCR